ncbi:hypothetical protein VTN00DRAFT_6555 [Thermoascus crustaceus]|uniref:uncharacterized protein n=1 Tax=Thermoascus crustaceus TaxID=5088 RepID=UPI003743A4F2
MSPMFDKYDYFQPHSRSHSTELLGNTSPDLTELDLQHKRTEYTVFRTHLRTHALSPLGHLKTQMPL